MNFIFYNPPMLYSILALLVIVIVLALSPKLRRLLSLHDWVWSIPIGGAFFFFVGIATQWFFGDGAGVFDPAYIQKAFLASFYMIVGNTVTLFGMWFNMRGIYRYFYNRESSIKEDFKTLSSWQKISLFVLLYCFLQLEYTLILFGIA